MLHYNPRHVSSSTVLIFRRTNCIITASGIVTLCKRLYSTPVEQSALYRRTVLTFLGAFAKSRKAPITFAMSVRPSVRVYQRGSH